MDAPGDKARAYAAGFFRQLMFTLRGLRISSAATGPRATTPSSKHRRRVEKLE